MHYLSLWTNSCKKKNKNKKKQKQTNVATLNSANQAKKQFNFGTGWLEP